MQIKWIILASLLYHQSAAECWTSTSAPRIYALNDSSVACLNHALIPQDAEMLWMKQLNLTQLPEDLFNGLDNLNTI